MTDDALGRAYEEYMDAIMDEITEYATIKLPDGRLVDAKCETRKEGSYSYFEPSTLELEWHDGDELTHEEWHIEIDGSYLHEWVLDHWGGQR